MHREMRMRSVVLRKRRARDSRRVREHYDALIGEGDDPVTDPEPLRSYMDRWDGKLFLDALALKPDKSVLEIGVGTGRMAVRTAPYCAKFVGIDLSPEAVARAKMHLQLPNCEILCGDFLCARFGEGFDVIFSTLTFLHIREKRQAVRKVYRLLRRGGRFVLTVDRNRKRQLRCGNRRVPLFPDRPQSMKRLLKEEGLRVVKMEPMAAAFLIVAEKMESPDDGVGRVFRNWEQKPAQENQGAD